MAIALTIQWQSVAQALQQLWDWVAIRSALILKGNILVRFLVLISTYAIFTNLSASLGTETLASNGLLLQIALLSQFTVQGIGMTTQTLVGNFNGKGKKESLLPVLGVAIAHAIAIALGFGLTVFLFPGPVFGLLTSHGDVAQAMGLESVWLIPLLVCTAVAFMLEGYFIGLKQGAALRNGALLAFGFGFGPFAIAAIYFQSNALLWSALVGYMALLMGSLAVMVVGQQRMSLAGDLERVLDPSWDEPGGEIREITPQTSLSLPNQKVIR